MKNLRDVESHFEFGKNWASYAELIGDSQIEEARKGLLKLLPEEDFRGRSFLDIGCGSGVHALAAASLGVSNILAADIDPHSVVTTRAVLERHNLAVPWRAEEISVFDLDPSRVGSFDIVYSWGVLHHTGDMDVAIGKAAALVAPGGYLAIALYRKTHLDWFWVREKRWYAAAAPWKQKFARDIYLRFFKLIYLLQGRSMQEHRDSYAERGMDFQHDVHDWLGGYPYESILATELTPRMKALGFELVREFSMPMTRGLLGSGCDEYVYRRVE
jgi:2-polyprenyl-6-hydroxyphenyl methylase/3-demethylubiquinone-9 3-methyltransferase